MILELLSFLPMIHEDMKIGKAGMEIERKATETFRSTDTFWEGIYRAWKNGARDFKINGKIKHIKFTESDLKLNMDLEKENFKSLSEEIRYIENRFRKEFSNVNNSEYNVYDTNGDVVRSYYFYKNEWRVYYFLGVNVENNRETITSKLITVEI